MNMRVNCSTVRWNCLLRIWYYLSEKFSLGMPAKQNRLWGTNIFILITPNSSSQSIYASQNTTSWSFCSAAEVRVIYKIRLQKQCNRARTYNIRQINKSYFIDIEFCASIEQKYHHQRKWIVSFWITSISLILSIAESQITYRRHSVPPQR